MPTNSFKPERLNDRLKWMIENLETPQDILQAVGRTNRLEGTTDLIAPEDRTSALEYVMRMRGDEPPSKSTFFTYKWSKKLWKQLLPALQEIFPAASRAMFTTKKYSDFEALAKSNQKTVQPWLDATATVAQRRGPLAKAALAYYADVSEPPADFPDFPLVTKSGWITDKPVRLTEEMTLSTFDEDIGDAAGPVLWNGGSRYHPLKRVALKIARQDRKKADITNGPTFRLTGFNMDPDTGLPHFTFAPGRYFNYIDTLEVLAAEFAKDTGDGAQGSDTHWLRGSPGDIFTLSNRSAFPGVNCLLLVKNFEGHKSRNPSNKFAIHERTENTIEAQNTLHVFPAGGHQPQSQDYRNRKEHSIWRTAVREFLEELFDKEELARIHNGSEDFFEHPEVKPYIDAIFRFPRCAAVYFLGMGFDPLTTKPEILVSIVVDWERVAFAPDNPRLGHQSFEKDMEKNFEGGEVHFEEATSDNLKKEAIEGRNGKPALPAGAACMLLASRPGFLEHMLAMK